MSGYCQCSSLTIFRSFVNFVRVLTCNHDFAHSPTTETISRTISTYKYNTRAAMPTDTAALAALVIAVVALIVATAQLTQALMATAYTIRKCDGIVTGGLTKGGVRRWHWRQFRFTVNYQSIVFALPASIYSALGISPTVRLVTPSPQLWMKAMKLRESRSHSTQRCCISFVQDLVMFNCIRPEDMSVMDESGDRIPDDLTVAPTRVDAISVMLTCIAMGMQVFRYSPTTGEIALGGGVGSISSSTHPVLGCLLHYSVFSNEPSIGFEATRRHGRALRQENGVWANTVFGRFKHRSFSPELVSLEILRERNLPVLRAHGWPEDSITDTISGAACFMAFAHVDVSWYPSFEPSIRTYIDTQTRSSLPSSSAYLPLPSLLIRGTC